jgi:exonuclease VII small subunit
MAKEKFEDALNKLEKIVSKLEEEEISLEDSLKLRFLSRTKREP